MSPVDVVAIVEVQYVYRVAVLRVPLPRDPERVGVSVVYDVLEEIR